MFNKVILVGNLTRDVELRYLNTGSAVATVGLASNRRYKRQDGTQVDDTCFVDVTFFGRTAEVANQYLKKGSKVLVEGRLNFEQWMDQQGNKRSRHTIIAETMQMLDSRQQNADYPTNQDSSYPNPDYVMQNYGQPYAPTNMQNTYYSHQNTSSVNNVNKVKGAYPEPPEINIDEEVPF